MTGRLVLDCGWTTLCVLVGFVIGAGLLDLVRGIPGWLRARRELSEDDARTVEWVRGLTGVASPMAVLDRARQVLR